MSDKKNPPHRPNHKFYEILELLEKNYIEQRAQGVSIWRWCAVNCVSLRTMDMYKAGDCNADLKSSKEYKHFLHILEQGDNFYKAHVHDIVQGNANGDIKGNGACANFIASNVLGWSSKQEQKVEPGDNLKKFELSYRIEKNKDD